jgi:hypothetical protein
LTITGGTPFPSGTRYTYNWSATGTGATLKVDASNPSTAATTATTDGQLTLWVDVYDGKGCTAQFGKTISVKDIRCGQKLDKVAVCDISSNKQKSECANENKVPKMLSDGGHLGECNIASITESVVAPLDTLPFRVEALSIKAIPNPASNEFIVTVNGVKTNEKMTLRVVDLYGRMIEVKSNITAGSSFSIGSKYSNGYYFIQLINGRNLRQVKVLKQAY